MSVARRQLPAPCGCAVASGEGSTSALADRQRRARALAGVALCGVSLAAARWPNPLAAPVALVSGWLGASHLVAAAPAYRGCPELGAIPSLFLGRSVETRCGPWELLDRRLGLEGTEE